MESNPPPDILQPLKLRATPDVARYPLLIDTRDPDDHPWEPHLAPFSIKRVCLPFGDVTLKGFEREFICERKTLSDLVAFCGRERPRGEKVITGMLGHRLPLLVIEATYADFERGEWLGDMKPSHILGALSGWEARGIHIVPAGNAPAAARYVARAAYTLLRRAWSNARDLLAAAIDAEGDA